MRERERDRFVSVVVFDVIFCGVVAEIVVHVCRSSVCKKVSVVTSKHDVIVAAVDAVLHACSFVWCAFFHTHPLENAVVCERAISLILFLLSPSFHACMCIHTRVLVCVVIVIIIAVVTVCICMAWLGVQVFFCWLQCEFVQFLHLLLYLLGQLLQ